MSGKGGFDGFGFRSDRDTGSTDERTSHGFYSSDDGKSHGHIGVDTQDESITFHNEPDGSQGSTTWDDDSSK